MNSDRAITVTFGVGVRGLARRRPTAGGKRRVVDFVVERERAGDGPSEREALRAGRSHADVASVTVGDAKLAHEPRPPGLRDLRDVARPRLRHRELGAVAREGRGDDDARRRGPDDADDITRALRRWRPLPAPSSLPTLRGRCNREQCGDADDAGRGQQPICQRKAAELFLHTENYRH